MPVERLSEGEHGPVWIRYEHAARYAWVAPRAEGRQVVDAACGTGYGSAVLLEHGATSVDGFDVSAESVEEARLLHAADRVRFEVGDATALPSADSSYDLFVSFETIEHIVDDRAFLAEVTRVLRPDGTFVCSTPNRRVTNAGTALTDAPFNQFHVREYAREEFESLLREYFDDVEVLGQTPRRRSYLSALNRLGRFAPLLAVRAHQVRKVLGIPTESLDRHWPEPWPGDGEHEVLLAVCRRAR